MRSGFDPPTHQLPPQVQSRLSILTPVLAPLFLLAAVSVMFMRCTRNSRPVCTQAVRNCLTALTHIMPTSLLLHDDGLRLVTCHSTTWLPFQVLIQQGPKLNSAVQAGFWHSRTETELSCQSWILALGACGWTCHDRLSVSCRRCPGGPAVLPTPKPNPTPTTCSWTPPRICSARVSRT